MNLFNVRWAVAVMLGFALGAVSAQQATVEITAGQGINASTFGNGSIVVTNGSATHTISSISIDLSSAILADVVFDPVGTAGDATAKCLQINSGGNATGYVVPTDNCVDPFGGSFHNGRNTDQGYDVATLDFTDFGPGETITFSIDIDPTTIRGAGGAGDAGSVSGAELTGATITIVFEDGATTILSGEVFREAGSDGGGIATVGPAAPAAAPTLSVQGVTLQPVTLSADHSVASVTSDMQTIEVIAPDGATVRLLHVLGEITADYEREAFEADSIISIISDATAIATGGVASFPVTLGRNGDDQDLNYFVAVVEDMGSAGLRSNIVVLELDPDGPPVRGDVLYRINNGGPVLPAADASMPDWAEDTVANPASQNNVAPGSGPQNKTFTKSGSDPAVTFGASNATAVPQALFNTERWDPSGNPELEWDFPVTGNQNYIVRLHFAEIFAAATSAGSRFFDVEIEGNVVLDDIDPTLYAAGRGFFGFATEHEVTVTDGNLDLNFLHQTGGDNPAVKGIEILEAAPPAPATASALIEITPNGGIGASTFSAGGFQITNQSTGGELIESVTIDLSTAILPDIVFDPLGDAGDEAGKCLTPDGGAAATGYVAGDPCVDPFSSQHDGGFDVATLSFNDFGPGETFSFSTDVDPTNVKNAMQTGDAGAVSGAELTGATVTVNFSGGAVGTAEAEHESGTFGGSFAVTSGVAPAPAIDTPNITLTPLFNAPNDGRHSGAVVADTGSDMTEQIELEIMGEPNQDIRIVIFEMELLAVQGFELEFLEANEAIDINEFTTTLDGTGAGTVMIPITRSSTNGGFNYVTATADDSAGGVLNSNYIVLELDSGTANLPPNAVDDVASVDKGMAVTIDVLANDSDTDGVLDFGSVVVTNQPDFGTAVVEATGDITYTHDGSENGPDSFTYSVTDNDGDSSEATVNVTINGITPVGILYRVNAGGPELPAIDGGPVWSEDSSGNPSPFIAGGNLNIAPNGTFPTVPLDATVPLSTPPEVFEKERWDPASGDEMLWNFPVGADQVVEVRLYFCDCFGGTAAIGDRVFDVSIDGTLVLDDFDIIASANDQTATMRSFVITTDSDGIDILFEHGEDNPLINAFEIIAAGGQSDVLGSSVTSIDFGEVLVSTTAMQSIQLTNLGDMGDPSIDIIDASITGMDMTVFADDFPGGPVTLAPGDSTTITVDFTPDTATSFDATLSITHSGSNTPIEVALSGLGTSDVPISFEQDDVLGGSAINNPTSLQFGPDGRLYISQQDGQIKVYDVVRNGPADYTATEAETITSVANIQNHNDDGTTCNSGSCNGQRQVTGILVTGTPEIPVLYVSSSDPRIGAGGTSVTCDENPNVGDENLDTNSGIVSRLTWNPTTMTWDHVDLVRGLPRSEENHSVNGMALSDDGNTLYLAVGGFTNQGAPSGNFACTPEYALSAAILTIDLATIGDTTYDLPTLDDEDRANLPMPADGYEDQNDPFGGNNGKNQAIYDPTGPVDIYATGYRNHYDLVMTEAGLLYTYDNGPNSGWGDVPLVSMDGLGCTNDFNEPGQKYFDQLHLVTMNAYGGHPNPTRADMSNTFNTTNPQSPMPMDWLMINPDECTYLPPADESPMDGQLDDGALTNVNASTNGIAEYTASNFGGQLQGDLLAASFNETIQRIKTDSTGQNAVLSEALFSNFGNNPLDVIAQGDDDVFPGTIWAVVYGADSLVVFEPSELMGCTGADNDAIDEDGDMYSNADEIDNGTEPCSAGSVPADFDKTVAMDGFLDSNLNDPDDDDDGFLDTVDVFAVDPFNGRGDGTNPGDAAPPDLLFDSQLPRIVDFENESTGSSSGNGLLGLTFTGVMMNGMDYLTLFSPGNFIAGGAAGVFTIQNVDAGDAFSGDDDQQDAMQIGVDIGPNQGLVTAHTIIQGLFSGITPENFMSAGLHLGTGDQDNYVKFVATAGGDGSGGTAGTGGFQLGVETSGSFAGVLSVENQDILGETIELFVTIDTDVSPPTATAFYRVGDGGDLVEFASTTIPDAWIADPDFGLAVGLIATSNGGFEFPVTFRTLEVFAGAANMPPVLDPLVDRSDAEGDAINFTVGATDPDGDPLTFAATGLPGGLSIVESGMDAGNISGTIDFDAAASSPYTVEVTVTDDDAASDMASFTWTVTNTNRAPIVDAIGDQSNLEGETIMPINVVATDPDDDELSYEAVNLPPGLVIDMATGEISGTIANEADESYTVTVTVTDDDASPLATDIVFDWAVANPIPTVEAIDDQSNQEGDTVSLQVVGSDADDTVGYSAMGLPTGLGIDPLSGLISGTIDATAANVYAVTVTVGDGEDSADESFSWTVTNPVPTITDIADQNSLEGEMISLQVMATDSDDPTLTYGASNLPTGLSIDTTTGLISGTIGNMAANVYMSEVTVNDGQDTTTESFTWTVVNPTITIDPISDQSNLEGEVVSLQVLATDADDTISYAAMNLPDGLAIGPDDGLIEGTITNAAAGTYMVTVTADDGQDPQQVMFDWMVENPAPVLPELADQQGVAGEAADFSVAGTDPDGDVLSYEATGLPAGLAIDMDSGQISGTIASDAAGNYGVFVEVTDADGDSDSDAFNYSVGGSADLAVTKTDGLDFVNPFDTVDYTIAIVNNGPSDAPEGRLSDPVPDGLIDASWICIASGTAFCKQESGVGAIDQRFSIPVGETVTFVLSGTFDNSVEQLSNTASVSSLVDDPDLANNIATDTSEGPDPEPPADPVVSAIGVTDDGTLDDGEQTFAPITQLSLDFGTVPFETLINQDYALVGAGEDGSLETMACGTPAGDDVSITIENQFFPSGGSLVILILDIVPSLPAGDYRLLVCQPAAAKGEVAFAPFELDFEVTRTNLFAEPTFDSGFGPWQDDGPSGGFDFVFGDSPSTSGRAVASGEVGTYVLTQCVNLDLVGGAATGARLAVDGNAGLSVEADVYAEENCMGDSLGLQSTTVNLEDTGGEAPRRLFGIDEAEDGTSVLVSFMVTLTDAESTVELDDAVIFDAELLLRSSFEAMMTEMP